MFVMRLIFIRHGEPDYEKNVLTELGHKQAEICACRLLKEFKIDDIYSSSYGRAVETAEHYANKVGKTFEQIDDFIEVDWKPDKNIRWQDDNPWKFTREYLENRKGKLLELPNPNIENENEIIRLEKRYVRGLDSLLERYGLIRDKNVYKYEVYCDKTIVIFAHGGMITFCLSHLLGINPTLLLGIQHFDHTSITVVDLMDKKNKKIILPRINRVNDHAHLGEINYID